MACRIQENAFQNVVSEMAAILYRPQCVKLSGISEIQELQQDDMFYRSRDEDTSWYPLTSVITVTSHERHGVSDHSAICSKACTNKLTERWTEQSRKSHTHYDDVMTWKQFPHYWPFMMGTTSRRWFTLHNSPVRQRFDVVFVVILLKQT